MWRVLYSLGTVFLWLTAAILVFNLVQRRVGTRASDKRIGSLIVAACTLGAFVVARILTRVGAGDTLAILPVAAWIGALVATRRMGIGVYFGSAAGETLRERLFGPPERAAEDRTDQIPEDSSALEDSSAPIEAPEKDHKTDPE